MTQAKTTKIPPIESIFCSTPSDRSRAPLQDRRKLERLPATKCRLDSTLSTNQMIPSNPWFTLWPDAANGMEEPRRRARSGWFEKLRYSQESAAPGADGQSAPRRNGSCNQADGAGGRLPWRCNQGSWRRPMQKSSSNYVQTDERWNPGAPPK